MENATFAAPVLLTRGQSFTLKELAESYMACYSGHDANTGPRLKFFVDRLGDRIAQDLDPDEIQDCLDELGRRGRMHNIAGRHAEPVLCKTGKPLAVSTRNRYRMALQSCLSWAKKKRLFPRGWTNPVTETEQLKENNARVRYLSSDEYNRLLRVARVSAWRKLPTLIKLAVTTGARKSSLMGLRWQDVDLENGRAYVERTKNGESFTLVLLPDVVQELTRLKGAIAKPDDLVFSSEKNRQKAANFAQVWKSTLREARIEGACFHTLRHTHASWLAQQGASLLAIADSMGHKSLVMTRRYSHLCVDNRAEMINRVFARVSH